MLSVSGVAGRVRGGGHGTLTMPRMASRWDRVERLLMPVCAVVAVAAAWLLKLWYDTSSYTDQTSLALYFWPAVGGAAFFSLRAVYLWMPQRLQQASLTFAWELTAARVTCVTLAAASLLTLGRELIFMNSGNPYVEHLWAYYAGPARLFFSVPPLTLIGSIALWPARSTHRPRSILTIAFAALALYALYNLWQMLTTFGCVSCSGPAL